MSVISEIKFGAVCEIDFIFVSNVVRMKCLKAVVKSANGGEVGV